VWGHERIANELLVKPGLRVSPRTVAKYVQVVIEHHSRRLIHFNVTEHPMAQWTRQQWREAVKCEGRCEYLLHDREVIAEDSGLYQLPAAA
jgi:hypothetical protein